jgi:hypothetical protein
MVTPVGQNTFRTKHDGISSILMAKQYGVSIYMITLGVKYPNFEQK